MSRKRKLPFWLAIVLAMLLVVLIVLVAMVPQPETDGPASRIQLPATQHVYPPDPQPEPLPEPVNEVATTAPQQVRPETEVVAKKTGRGFALIMDDVGYDIRALKRLLKLNVPLAVSVLPDAPFARQSARLAKQAGQVVMLHLPMQPESGSHRLTDSFLHADMSEQALRDTFLRNIKQVPFIEGVNNHMGSKLTQLTEPMGWVMQLCREQGLFFVDSRTSPNSVAAKVAKNTGLAWATRQIFLDHEMSTAAMLQAWNQVRSCVQKGYRCIVIGHPRSKTITFLEDHLSTEDAANMVSIKQMLRKSHLQEQPPAPQVTASEPILP